MQEQSATDDIDNYGHFVRAEAQDVFAKTGMSHEEKFRFNMSSLHVPVCADLW